MHLLSSENLKKIPDKINENIGKKNYLTAAQLVVEAKETLQGNLLSVGEGGANPDDFRKTIVS